MAREYITIALDKGPAFIKRSDLQELAKVDAIVFDCDGVLIDVQGSYFAAIKETVKHISSQLMGAEPDDGALDRAIYLLKRSGGFNNDWDTAYAISLALIASLPEEMAQAFVRVVSSEAFDGLTSPQDRMAFVKEYLLGGGKQPPNATLPFNLLKIASRGSVLSLEDFEERLFLGSLLSEGKKETLHSGKKFLSYPGRVGVSLLSTIFEELFLGPSLFEKTYGIKCTFYNGRGLIENEAPIVDKGTLDQLTSAIGRANFGIASGRPSATVWQTLGSLLEAFKPTARVFLEDIGKAEDEAKGGAMGKPDPFCLLKSAEGLKPFSHALYVGDSMEDALLVDLANEDQRRYLFAGVYLHSPLQKNWRSDFLKKGAALIIPSVKELPTALAYVRREGRA